jgi:peptidoglycan/xylan/chitin deacetylase (PgdA/CDA1 family)
MPSPTASLTRTPTPLAQLIAPILMYHEFDDRADIYSVRPDLFRAQLRALKAAGYTPVTMRQIADAFDHGGALPAHPVVITLDDARATQKTAIDILKSEGFSATLFVPSGWHELPVSYIVELDHQGFDVESHTVWHADLVRTPDKITEIGQGQKTLEGWLGRPVDGFAYPYGHYLPRDITELQRLGFRYAVSIRQSVLLRADERYAWPRLLVTNYPPDELLARITDLIKQAQTGHAPPAPGSFDG